MAKPLTLAQAKALRPGQTLYHLFQLNADGTAQRWSVNGKPQVWKTRPDEVRVPVKRGLYTYDQVTERELHLVSLTEPSRVPKDKIKGSGYKGYHR